MANKKRKCRNCKGFYPVDSGIVVPLGFFHSMDCATEYRFTDAAKSKVAREKKKAEKEFRAETKHRKDGLKPLYHWLKLTQVSVNAYILVRDKDKPCVSCGAYDVEEFHAGHYLSVGGHPSLRFETLNLAKQCSKCNTHLSGNQTNYRIELVNRIGEDKVLWLEGPHKAKHYTRDQLKEIRVEYNRKTRELKACNPDIFG